MTQDEIIRMVYEACGVIYKPFPGVSIGMTHEHLERFAALVTEAEREKIALAYKTRPRGKSEAPHMIAAYRAMQMALEALEKCRDGFEYTRQYVGYETLPSIKGWSWYDGDLAATDAITALREALENNELSDVTLINEGDMVQPQDNLNCKSVQARLATLWGYVKAQPQDHSEQHLNMVQGEWVDLRDVEIGYIYDDVSRTIEQEPMLIRFAKEVIAKFKEKNTPPSVEAAIEATKEKAAKVCEEVVIENGGKTARNKTSFECAAAIRSMK